MQIKAVGHSPVHAPRLTQLHARDLAAADGVMLRALVLQNNIIVVEMSITLLWIWGVRDVG